MATPTIIVIMARPFRRLVATIGMCGRTPATFGRMFVRGRGGLGWWRTVRVGGVGDGEGGRRGEEGGCALEG